MYEFHECFWQRIKYQILISLFFFFQEIKFFFHSISNYASKIAFLNRASIVKKHDLQSPEVIWRIKEKDFELILHCQLYSLQTTYFYYHEIIRSSVSIQDFLSHLILISFVFYISEYLFYRLFT